MPRYFFDLKREDADFDVDGDGVELKDMEAAEQEAFRAVGDLLRDHLLHGKPDSFVMQVRDEAGAAIMRTAVSVQHEKI